MIVVEKSAAATALVITRPTRRNALDQTTLLALREGIREAEADTACHCLVLRGAGGTFCSGRDLGDARRDAPLEELLAYDETWGDIIGGLRAMTKPSIAVVSGHAVAGGFTLAMACDFVLAERGARFGALEMRGGFPAAVNTAVLTHLVSRRIALRYLLSDETFAAEELLAHGLVSEIADGGSALERLEAASVERLTRLDPTAVKLTKEANRSMAASPEDVAIRSGSR
ncbi:MAG TPA: enoyl-CoA hydratase/isomerase family protein, partial [Hyphomicrobiaceae bacterium]|nr:enoyl-CoA hydratase/isomerase family protein [Hyphomicrobiaceae bacterium]